MDTILMARWEELTAELRSIVEHKLAEIHRHVDGAGRYAKGLKLQYTDLIQQYRTDMKLKSYDMKQGQVTLEVTIFQRNDTLELAVGVDKYHVVLLKSWSI